ncbi:MAG: sulfotransferase family protein, partial [Cyanobacteria bacterium J06632_22]
WNDQEALDYYCGRLRTLARYAELIETPARMMVVTYAQMLNQTAAALTTLQNFLQTPVTFSEEYQVLKTTGIKGIGDSKGNIKAGKIVRAQRPLTREFNADLLQEAQATYDQVSATLFQRCQGLPSGGQ